MLGRTGKEGSKLPVVQALAWAALQGVIGRGRDTLGRGHFSGDRLLGALLRKACSSSSWRTPRSGEEEDGGRGGGMVSGSAGGPGPWCTL